MTSANSSPLRRAGWLAVLWILSAGLSASPASQIASTLNGSDQGDLYILYTVWAAVPFTTDDHSYLSTDIVAKVGVESTDYSQVGIHLRIYSDESGEPGAPIGGRFFPTQQIFVNSTRTFLNESAGSVHLDPTTDYWVVFGIDVNSGANPRFQETNLTPGDGPGSIFLGAKLSTDFGGTWTSPSHLAGVTVNMQINGQVIGVPEPSTVVMAGVACAGLVATGWRRRRAVRDVSRG
jgi:hypothetical protein